MASQNQRCTVQCVDTDTCERARVWLPRSIVLTQNKSQKQSQMISFFFLGRGGRLSDPPSCCVLMYTLNSNLTTSNLMANTTALCMCIQPLCCRNRASYQYCHMGRSHSIGQVAGGSIDNTGGTVITANYTLFLPLFYVLWLYILLPLLSVYSASSRPSRDNMCFYFVLFCFL